MQGPLPLPKGTRLSISTTGFSRLLFNSAVPGFHQSTSHKFRLLITVFIVGVGLISRMTVLVLLKQDIIPQNQVLIDCCFIRPRDFHQTREGRTSQPAAVAFPSSLHEPSKGLSWNIHPTAFPLPPSTNHQQLPAGSSSDKSFQVLPAFIWSLGILSKRNRSEWNYCRIRWLLTSLSLDYPMVYYSCMWHWNCSVLT